jgi:starvation-inducible DNA-binding protein
VPMPVSPNPTDEDRRAAMIEAWVHILGNGCRLFRTARVCAWNVRGQGAERAAPLFAAQAKEVWRAQDIIAARVRALGGLALPDDSDAVIVTRPAEIDYLRCLSCELVVLLADGHKAAIVSLEAAGDVAEAINDEASQRLVTARAQVHRLHARDLHKLLRD